MLPVPAGLCTVCTHAKISATRRGTAYLRCLAAADDPRLAKYPQLPVLACKAFTPGDPGDQASFGPS